MGESVNNNKKNWIYLICSIMVVVSLALSILAFTKQTNIAYIDSSLLMNGYRGAQKANATLTSENEELQGNIKTLEDELSALNSEFVEKGASWDKKTVKEKQTQLETKQQEYYKYRRAIEDKQAKREQELMQPVFDQLNADLKAYGRKNHYDIILGTVTGGNILYGEDLLDITDEFLEYANSFMEDE